MNIFLIFMSFFIFSYFYSFNSTSFQGATGTVPPSRRDLLRESDLTSRLGILGYLDVIPELFLRLDAVF